MAKSKDKTPAPAPPPPPPPPAYTVVARRYRPQQFADLIGQEHVAAALTNAITSGRLAHAYLFTGARGTGKTSTARILAKALNCEKGPTPTPCDVCDICRSVIQGNDVDVVEIDGASNNKVDEARELRSNVGFRPTRARFKVYIIDEVHMLSTGAFNALLKTMEEPPPHVKFILATTEVQKIPITILSRCQRYQFHTVGPAKIFATLRHIAAKEGIDADADALRVVAARANGSMRDSQTLLEQLLGACEGKLTAEKVHALFGTAGDERVVELADAIVGGDARRAVELVGTSAEQGLQLGELVDQLVEFWRGMMLAAVGGADLETLPGSATLVERVKAHAAGRDLDTILAGLDILTNTKGKMRNSPHTQVLLEVAVVRLARLDELLNVAQLTQWATGGTPVGKEGSGKAPAHGPGTPAAESVKKKLVTGPEVRASASPVAGGASGAAGGSDFSESWGRVLEQVGPMLSAQLRQVSNSPAIVGPNALAISYSAAYSSTADAVRGERSLDTLRRALKHITGHEWAVRVEVEAAAHSSENGQPAPAVTAATPAKTKTAVLGLPFFQAAGEVLGAQLMRMDDGFDPTAEPPAVVVATATPPADDPDEIPTPTDPDEG